MPTTSRVRSVGRPTPPEIREYDEQTVDRWKEPDVTIVFGCSNSRSILLRSRGRGRLSGQRRFDTTPPRLITLSVSPSQLDTSGGKEIVIVTIVATDAVCQVSVFLQMDAQLVS